MNILFIFTLGSEVRQFLHSGIITSLIDKGHKVYISFRDIDELRNEILQSEPRIIKVDYYNLTPKRSALSYIVELLNRIYEKDIKIWEYKPERNKKHNLLIRIVINATSNSLCFKILKRFENIIFKISSMPTQWVKLLKRYKIDIIVVNVPNNALLALIAAYKLKVKRCLLYHTNKDIFTQGRLIVKFDKIGFWNREMERVFILKYGIQPRVNLQIVGNSHFSYLAKKNLLLTKEELFNKLGLKIEDEIVLYTAAAPWVIKNEHIYLNIIRKFLDDINLKHFKIILRKNPMDDTDFWDRNITEGIIVQRPQWYWDKLLNINFTFKEDLIIYRSLLYHAKCCINIPSSVTIEAAIMNLPIINICYDEKNVEVMRGMKVIDFWNAEFNSLVRESNVVFPSFSNEELKNNLVNVLVNEKSMLYENRNKFLEKILTFQIDELTKKSVEFIIN